MAKLVKMKARRRLCALLVAASMVVGFATPASVYAQTGEESGFTSGASDDHFFEDEGDPLPAESEDTLIPAKDPDETGGKDDRDNERPKVNMTIGDEEDVEGDEEDPMVTIGVSTLLETISPDDNISIKLSAESSVSVGEWFNLRVEPSFNGWLPYDYPGFVSGKDILSSVDDFGAVIVLPAGIEYGGISGGGRAEASDGENGSTILRIELGGGRLSTGYSGPFTISVRMLENGHVENGTPFSFTAGLYGTMNIVTEYEPDGRTPQSEEAVRIDELPDWGYDLPAASCSVNALAREDWDSAKTAVGSAEYSGGKIKFRFETGAGLLDAGGIVSDPNAAGVYNRAGRLFFDQDADTPFAIDETVKMLFRVPGSDETHEVSIAPDSVRITYESMQDKFDDASAPPQWEDLKDRIGDMTREDVLSGSASYFTSGYFNELTPNAAGDGYSYVGLSPSYTKYYVDMTFDYAEILAKAQSLGIGGSCEFVVMSSSALSYTLLGQSRSNKEVRSAEQSYGLGAAGGTVRVHQYFYRTSSATGARIPYGPDFPGMDAQGNPVRDPEFRLMKLADGVWTEDTEHRPVRQEITTATPAGAVTEYVFVYEGLVSGVQYKVEQKKGVEGYLLVESDPAGGFEVADRQVSTVIFTSRPLSAHSLSIHKVIAAGSGSQGKPDETQAAQDVEFAAYRYDVSSARDDAEANRISAEAKKVVSDMLAANHGPEEARPAGAGWYFANTLGGVATFDLPEGDYYIFELKNAYSPNTEIYSASVTKNGASDLKDEKGIVVGTQENPVVNTRTTGSFTVVKDFYKFMNYTGARFGLFKVSDAADQKTHDLTDLAQKTEFEVFVEENGLKTAVTTTDGQGTMTVSPLVEGGKATVRVDDLPAGTYWLREKNAGRDGWMVYYANNLVTDGYIGPFVVQRGQVTASSSVISNVPDLSGYIFIRKVGLTEGGASVSWDDEKGLRELLNQSDSPLKGLSGAQFKLEDKDGSLLKFRALEPAGRYVLDHNGPLDTLTAGGGGLLLVTGLREGEEYTLTETKAPDGYEIPEGSSVRKIKALSFVPAHLGGSPNDEYAGDGSGVGNGSVSGPLFGESAQLYILNVRRGSMDIAKQTDYGMKVAGAEFDVYVRSSDTYEKYQYPGAGNNVTAMSDQNGKLIFTNTLHDKTILFEAGRSYYLHETAVPDGYVSPTQEEIDALVKAGKAVEAQIGGEKLLLYGPYTLGGTNAPIINKASVRAAFVIDKTTDGGVRLGGAQMQVRYGGKKLAGAYYNTAAKKKGYAFGDARPLQSEMTPFDKNDFLTQGNGLTYVEVEVPAAILDQVVSGQLREFKVQVTEVAPPALNGKKVEYSMDPKKKSQEVTAYVLDAQGGLPAAAAQTLTTFENLRSVDVKLIKYSGAVGVRSNPLSGRRFHIYAVPVGQPINQGNPNGGAGQSFNTPNTFPSGNNLWRMWKFTMQSGPTVVINNMNPNYRYFIEEVQANDQPIKDWAAAAELFAGVDGSGWSGVSGVDNMVTIGAGGNARRAYEFTDLIRSASVSAGQKSVELYAYNVPQSGGSIVIQKFGIADPPIHIGKNDLAQAEFKVYAILDDGLSDESALKLSQEEIKAALGVRLTDVTPAKSSIVFSDGTVTFKNIANPAAGKQGAARYLVIEVTPPGGYVLNAEAYQDKDGGNGEANLLRNTRAVVSVDYNAGKTVNDRYYDSEKGGQADGVPTLLNAPETNLNLSDPAIEVRFIAPTAGGDAQAGTVLIGKPLEETPEGTQAAFTVANQTTLESNSPNLVSLENFSVSVQELRYYTVSKDLDEWTNDDLKAVPDAPYELTRVVVPFGRDMQGEVQPRAFVNGTEIEDRVQTSLDGEKAWAFTLPAQTKSFEILYGRETAAGDEISYNVGTNFQAKAMKVYTTLYPPQTEEGASAAQVRVIDALGKVSFAYQTSANGAMREKSAVGDSRITVARAEGYPEIEVTKSVSFDGQTQEASSANAARAAAQFAATIGSEVSYTVTAVNHSQKYDLSKPVIIDKLPSQVEYIPGSVTVQGAQFSGEPEVVRGKTPEGWLQTYLIFRFDQPLKPASSIAVSFKARVTQESSYMARNVENIAYVTSAQALHVTPLNPAGQVFRDVNGKEPVVDAALNNVCRILQNGQQYGTVSTSVSFGLAAGTNVVIRQFIKGEYELSSEQAPIKGTNETAVTTSSGRVEYWIVLTNPTANPISDIRLADALPVEGAGGSVWAPTLVGDEPVTVTGAGITGAKIYAMDGAESGRYITDKEMQTHLALGAQERWGDGWEPLSSFKNGTRDVIHLREEESERGQTVYPDVAAIGLEIEGTLPAYGSLTVHVRMVAPAWSEEDLNNVANLVAVNRAYYAAKDTVLGSLSNKTNWVYVTTQPLVSVGDLVWLDKNRDGIQNDADEGIGGVEVTLTKYEDGAKVDTLTYKGGTDEKGQYLFESLAPWSDEAGGQHYSYTLTFSGSGAQYVEMTKAGMGGYRKDSDGAVSKEFRFVRVGKTNVINTEIREGSVWKFQRALTPENGRYYDDSFDCGFVLNREAVLQKVDDQGHALSGAVFQLFEAGKSLPVARAVSDDDGIVRFKSGSGDAQKINYFTAYEARETEAPAGYEEANPNETAVVFEAGAMTETRHTLSSISQAASALSAPQFGEENTVENLPRGIPVSIVKTVEGVSADEALNMGDTFTFELYDVQTRLGRKTPAAFIGSAVIDAARLGNEMPFMNDGQAAVLTPGRTYAIREIVGYRDASISMERYALWMETQGALISDPDADGYRYFTVDEMKGEIPPPAQVKFTAVNTVKTGSFVIEKQLIDKKEPFSSGDRFGFEVYPIRQNDAEGKPQYASKTPVASAEIAVGESYTFEGLAIGRYAVKETSMAPGYVFKQWGINGSQTVVSSKVLIVTVTGDEKNPVVIQAVNDIIKGKGNVILQKQIGEKGEALLTGESRLAFTFALYETQKLDDGTYKVGERMDGRTLSVLPNQSQSFEQALETGCYAVSEVERADYAFREFTGDGQSVVQDGVSYFVFEIQDGVEQTIRITAVNDRVNPPTPPPPPPIDPDTSETETTSSESTSSESTSSESVSSETTSSESQPPESESSDSTPVTPEESSSSTSSRNPRPPSSSTSSSPGGNTNPPAAPAPEPAADQEGLVTIEDEIIPLAQDPLVTIPDEPIPLAGLPDAGGLSFGHLIPFGVLLSLAGFWMTRRRKKTPDGK